MMSSFVMATGMVLVEAGQGMFKIVKHDSVPEVVKERSCDDNSSHSILVPGQCYLDSDVYEDNDNNKKFIGFTKKVSCVAGVATVHLFEGSTNCTGTAKKVENCDLCKVFVQFSSESCYSCEAVESGNYVSLAWTNGPSVSCKSLLVPRAALLLPVKCWSSSRPSSVSENADGTLKVTLFSDPENKYECDGPIFGTASLKSGQCSSWEDAAEATADAVKAATKHGGSSGTVASVAPSFASVAMSSVASVFLAVEF